MAKLLLMIFCSALLMVPVSCKEKGNKPMTGGWHKVETNSIHVIKSFAYLKDEIKKDHPKIDLLEVLEAKSQVVAGTNYELTCKYQKGTESTTKQLTAVIYQDLQGQYKLTCVKLPEASKMK